MSFRQVEEILKEQLPKSARTNQAWWSGTAEGNPDIVQKESWTASGYQVDELDIPHESVTFKCVR